MRGVVAPIQKCSGTGGSNSQLCVECLVPVHRGPDLDRVDYGRGVSQRGHLLFKARRGAEV